MSVDIHQALDMVNELMILKSFVLKKQNYWYYDITLIKFVDNKMVNETVFSGDTKSAIIFLMGVYRGLYEARLYEET